MMNKMRKMKNKKGFTLMEMLIVVAIIAILVAIAIPTFASSLNKARVAVDEANIRSGYAEVMTEVLMNGDNYNVETGDGNELTYYLKADGSVATDKTELYATTGENKSAVKIAGAVRSISELEIVSVLFPEMLKVNTSLRPLSTSSYT